MECAACGAVSVATETKTAISSTPTDPLIGKKVAGFELVERLGAGGMGVVYKATQLSLGRQVAVKLLPEESRNDPQIEERFRREIAILAHLHHPNIVGIVDGGVCELGAYFVMELVDGISLRHVFTHGGLKPPETLRIIPQICDALEYAHSRGVIHRDIKPENILIDRSGRVRLLDFGLSRLVQQDAPSLVTRPTQVLGTFEYMAPEQREGSRSVDHRSDLYSLGVVIYEMLTGELPIGRFDPPSRKNVAIDVRIDEIVLRSLDKVPERRFQKASELKTEVERLSHVTTIPESPPVVAAAQATAPEAPSAAGSPPRPSESGTLLRPGSNVNVMVNNPEGGVSERTVWVCGGIVALCGLLGSGGWLSPVLAIPVLGLGYLLRFDDLIERKRFLLGVAVVSQGMLLLMGLTSGAMLAAILTLGAYGRLAPAVARADELLLWICLGTGLVAGIGSGHSLATAAVALIVLAFAPSVLSKRRAAAPTAA